MKHIPFKFINNVNISEVGSMIIHDFLRFLYYKVKKENFSFNALNISILHKNHFKT